MIFLHRIELPSLILQGMTHVFPGWAGVIEGGYNLHFLYPLGTSDPHLERKGLN